MAKIFPSSNKPSETSDFSVQFDHAVETEAAPKFTYMTYVMDDKTGEPKLIDGDKFSISVLIDSIANCVAHLEGVKKQAFLNKVCSAYGISTNQQLNLDEISDQLKESPIMREAERVQKGKDDLTLKQPDKDLFDNKKEAIQELDDTSVIEEI